MSYVCAYSSVRLDKSRVEKEFTTKQSGTYSCPVQGTAVMKYTYTTAAQEH